MEAGRSLAGLKVVIRKRTSAKSVDVKIGRSVDVKVGKLVV